MDNILCRKAESGGKKDIPFFYRANDLFPVSEQFIISGRFIDRIITACANGRLIICRINLKSVI